MKKPEERLSEVLARHVGHIKAADLVSPEAVTAYDSRLAARISEEAAYRPGERGRSAADALSLWVVPWLSANGGPSADEVEKARNATAGAPAAKSTKRSRRG